MDRLSVRFWSRLYHAGKTEVSRPVGSYDVFVVVDSIRDHLEWLLNTRQGDSPACPTYGLPDMSSVVAGLPSSENEFCRAVELSIRNHEPRIGSVEVRLEDSTDSGNAVFHFSIRFRLALSESLEKRISGEIDMESMIRLRS